jgi:hypothetical protein
VSAVLPIRDGMVSELLLLRDNLFDIPVFYRGEVCFGHFSLDQFIAFLHEKVCPEQRTEVLSAERGLLVTRHFENTYFFFTLSEIIDGFIFWISVVGEDK